MKITIGTIIGFIITFLLIFLLANYLIFSMCKNLCEESELKPFRYESQGLFGTLTKIETTEQNADGYAKFCIKHGEPSFWSISENMNYLIGTSSNTIECKNTPLEGEYLVNIYKNGTCEFASKVIKR